MRDEGRRRGGVTAEPRRLAKVVGSLEGGREGGAGGERDKEWRTTFCGV